MIFVVLFVVILCDEFYKIVGYGEFSFSIEDVGLVVIYEFIRDRIVVVVV